ncbi:MAG: nicotinate-nucleotide--dimethylbenzimidazole phosphoribosyltransferase [Rhodocyclaceae bacterium]|nr:MAG: nicotinate-nucleotide--dimethylbenzimidazole phosphoribosyltransferase [Rhodocyclaceae bacterium]TND03885.1 MAG: nicotinate-nucleotide--dimethylbenzimidazole phosphoribosyltransferase [Rhodocyclaceae bacterium]
MHSVAAVPRTFPRFEIAPLDRALSADLQHKIDQKTKPLGALGRLETLALQLGLIQRSLSPKLVNPYVLVCAGDHGAAKAGVSAFPQEVTWQMVENFLAGGAAINVFARQSGMTLVVADAGVAHNFGARDGLVDAKVGAGGTANYLEGAAMSEAECATAMHHGARLVREFTAAGCNVLGFGEMGIGNTAAASLITHCITGLALADCVGRGTGLDDAGLERKRALLAQALSIWPERPTAGKASADDALRVLARFGGYEIAMLAGAMLAAAEARMTLLIDGFIVTSALLVAQQVSPAVLDYCVFAHCSNEAGHRRQLDWLQAQPLLDIGLRLGEGTGAALALPLLNAACAFMNEMASFESAGVSEKS